MNANLSKRLIVLSLLALAFVATPQLLAQAPVQVYILLGQSNMLGFGTVAGTTDGTLQYAVDTKGLYPYLGTSSNWSERTDVRHVYVQSSGTGPVSLLNNEWMSVACESDGLFGNDNKIGPEYGIGHALGNAIDEPVMVLKSCIGNRSLGWDLLPPGSEQFVVGDYTYAGYGDSPDRWLTGTTPEPISWYAGTQYDGDIRNAKTVLNNIGDYYPGATEYEVAGFFFWQGDKDRYNDVHADRYEQNLVRLIEQLRTEFNAPNANFVCATLGQTEIGDGGNEGDILNAQFAVSDPVQYPQFEDNVATVYSNPLSLGGASNSHYNGNAETYMNVGEAMGDAMVSMLRTLPYATIDQQTGEIKLINPADGDIDMAFKDLTITSEAGALDPANWNPITGNYDLAGDGSVDDDGNWTVTTSTTGELTEAADAGGGDGLITIAQEVSLGVGLWIQNPTKDLQFFYTDAGGIVHQLSIRYVGTNTPEADMNFDGVVDELDWPIFLAGNQGDLASLSAAQKYQAGDLDGDGDSDIYDFALFREAFEAMNPAGAFEAMVASYVPEPGSILLLVGGAAGVVMRRRRRRATNRTTCNRARTKEAGNRLPFDVVVVLLAIGLCAGAAQAQTVTTYTGPNGSWRTDTWNNADNWDNGVPTGTIDVTVADGKYVSATGNLVGATTPVYNGDLTLGVGSKLEIGQYATADDLNALGTGTWTLNTGSDLTLRYTTNSTHDNDIIMAGDALFALGRSTSAHWEQRTLTGQISGTGLLTIHSTNGNWLHLTNSTSDWTGGLLAGGIHSENKKETISAEATGSLGMGDVTINDGVTLEISALNAMATTATLNLSGNPRSDETYKLGLSADQTVTNFSLDGALFPPGQYTSDSGLLDSAGRPLISGNGMLTVLEGPLLKLLVDVVTGDTAIVGHDAMGIDINYYQIDSEGGSLDKADWVSLADQDFEGGGDPTGFGDGWEEAGGSDAGSLAEAYLMGDSTIGTAQTVSLGKAFDIAVGVEDLVFTYRTDSGQIIEGLVEYDSSVPLGDANWDGVVDAADYLMLKQNFGLAPSGAGNGGDLNDDGIVDWADLNVLVSAMSGGGGAGGTVPEPVTLSMVALGSLALLRRRRC